MRPAKHHVSVTRKNKGFSLIELMVAIVLGLIITAGAISVYLVSKRSFTEVEQVAAVSENGRFAMRLLSSSIRHAGFFGGSSPIDIREDANLGNVTDDCSGDAAAYRIDRPFFAQQAGAGAIFGCITDARAGTDVLVLKNVEPAPLYDADPDNPNASKDGTLSFTASAPRPPATMQAPWSAQETYIVANTSSGLLIDGGDPAPNVGAGQEFANAAAWPYRFQIYYVRDAGVPTLARKYLAWDSTAGAMTVQTQDLVQGVEQLQFQFGVDSNNDGAVDGFANAAAVANDNAWDRVISLQAFILVRAEQEDPAYSNDKTYSLPGGDITPGDNFRRVMLFSELTLRNPRLLLRGGA